jgi:hypothetical protein
LRVVDVCEYAAPAAQEEGTIQVLVCTLNNGTVPLMVTPSTTTVALQQWLECMEGAPPEMVYFTYQGKLLDTIGACGVRAGEALHVQLRVRGGAPPSAPRRLKDRPKDSKQWTQEEKDISFRPGQLAGAWRRRTMTKETRAENDKYPVEANRPKNPILRFTHLNFDRSVDELPPRPTIIHDTAEAKHLEYFAAHLCWLIHAVCGVVGLPHAAHAHNSFQRTP